MFDELTKYSPSLLFSTLSSYSCRLTFFLQWLRNCKDTFPRCPGDSVVTCQPGDSEEKVQATRLQVIYCNMQISRGKHDQHVSHFCIWALYFCFSFPLCSFVILSHWNVCFLRMFAGCYLVSPFDFSPQPPITKRSCWILYTVDQLLIAWLWIVMV